MIITPIPPWQVLAIIMQGGSSIISPTPQWNVDVYALRRRWYPAGWCGASPRTFAGGGSRETPSNAGPAAAHLVRGAL